MENTLDYLLSNKDFACNKCTIDIATEIKHMKQHNTYKKFQQTIKTKDGSYYNGIGAMQDLLDLNINHKGLCRLCKGVLGEDRMVGGDGITGCDILPFRYHSSCFYGTFGHLD
tara:strand:+ start:181 stop:519 length:339 start_codon:yes stop_codon:yes gene_type:complete